MSNNNETDFKSILKDSQGNHSKMLGIKSIQFLYLTIFVFKR